MNVGVPLIWGAIPRLVALVGPSKAKELIMTSEPIGGREAYALGLVNSVTPDTEVLPAARALAAKILCGEGTSGCVPVSAQANTDWSQA